MAIYNDAYNVPSDPFIYIPINKWNVYGNAKLSTDQKFNGFSSLYIADSTSKISTTLNIDFSSDWTISFSYIANITPDSGIDTPFFKDATNNFMFGVTNNGSSHKFLIDKGGIKYVFEYTNIWIASGTNIKIDLIKVGNIYRLYINNKMVKEHTFDIDPTFNNTVNLIIAANSVNGRNFSGYYKNFKIYKGGAVIPEDPTGKIQLDFNNNVIDKYNNSTWANNGVTFDQVNSVKGHAAYFDGNALGIKSGINNNLNFENKNFIINFDFKAIELGRQYSSTIITSTQVGSYTSFSVSIPNGSTAISVSTTNDSMTGWGVSLFSAGTTILTNDYRNICVSRINNIFMLKDNDVVRSIANINTTQSLFNLNGGNDTIIGTNRNDLVGTKFKGYIDNFKSIKDYQENVVIDRPAVHLPLETNAINTGFTPLTINNVGSPTYTVVDGKKCIKFESGKYLTINNNNIFNLGTNSDFYIEFDFYIIDESILNVFLSNHTTFTNDSSCILYANKKIEFQFNNGTLKIYPTINTCEIGQFNNLKLYRMNNAIYMNLNGVETIINENYNINFSISNLFLGKSGWSSTDRLNGYMSNFKMFVGTSEIPETYNNKKVLDLDFKPTGKSYLFKDNNNKCVIHPVNITQRDYQYSQYCCTFNGTNQYLQLGKNDLLNFGNDDFIINIKFKSNIINGWRMLLCDAASSTNFIDIGSSGFLAVKLGGSRYDTPVGSIIANTIYDVIIQVINSEAKVYINGEQTTLDGMPSRIVNNVNFNLSNNTYIGCYLSNSEYFNGTIYSIKILRNTTDLSLLEDENTNVIVGETEVSYTLSNGFDEVSISKDTITEKSIQIVKDTNKVTAIIDDEILEVPATAGNVDTNDLYLFNEYKGNIKDLRVYNKAFYDKDVFEYDGPYDTELGLIDTLDNEYDEYIMVDQGDYIIKGYFEGIAEPHKWRIYNSINYDVLISGTSINYYYDGVDHLYKDDYKILDMVTNKTYDIVDMGPPGSIKVFINSKVCTGSNFVIRAYRRDSGVFIGEYELDKTRDPYECTIHNLDTTKTYDIMLFDKNNNIESRVMSNRSPEAY